jgi:hypothetical protein
MTPGGSGSCIGFCSLPIDVTAPVTGACRLRGVRPARSTTRLRICLAAPVVDLDDDGEIRHRVGVASHAVDFDTAA